MATGIRTYRPLITGTTHMVSTGHYLATAAGYRILEQGGNATDAGVAAGIVINVVLPQYTSFGGVAPIIIHDAQKQDTVEISGLGRWPAAASIDYFNQNCGGEIPVGVLRTVTPAAADGWLTALKLYGTMTFEQVVTPALELAEGGFPIPDTLHRALIGAGGGLEHYDGDNQKWQSTRDVFFPGGKVLETGALLVQKELAGTFRRLIQVERDNLSGGRDKALRAARDFFYHGEIAEEMVRFVQDQGGLLTMEDLAAFHVGVDKPAAGSYKGIDVYTCGPWCQGPVSIEALQILEGCDLQAMGHNSVDYIHTVLEALKLSFADRHHFYGDPDFIDVPMEGLTSKAFADERRRAIEPNRATPEMPEPGDPWRHQSGRPAGRGAAGAGERQTGSRHKLHLRGRPPRQRFLRHSQRRYRRRPGSHRAGICYLAPRLPKLAGRGSPLLRGSWQTAQANPQSCFGDARRSGIDAIRNAGRRRTVPVYGAIVPERSRVWHGPPASHRSASRLRLELPQLLLAPCLPPRIGGSRGPNRPINGRGVEPARPQGRSMGRLDCTNGKSKRHQSGPGAGNPIRRR